MNCIICGKPLTSTNKRAQYCSNKCRAQGFRNRKVEARSRSCDEKLQRIRKHFPRTAKHIDRVIAQHGEACGEAVIEACMIAFGEAGNFVTKMNAVAANQKRG